MPSDDRRASGTHNRRKRGIVIEGTGPREAPPKAWPSNKPPGGKLPSKGPEPDKKP